MASTVPRLIDGSGVHQLPDAGRPAFRAARSFVIAALTGGAVGVATSFGQGVMPGALNAFVNSVGAWLVAPFFVGAFTAGRLRGASVAGLVTCVWQVAGYYVTSELRGFAAGGSTVVLFWCVCGLLGGPLLGAGGWWWRQGQQRARSFGVSVLPSVFLVEGVWLYGVTLGYLDRAAIWVAIGVALAAVLSRGHRDLRAYAFLLPAGLLGEIALTTIGSSPL